MKAKLTVVFTTLLLFSCSTTKITSRWKARDITPQSYYREIMAVVIAGDDERSLAEKMESHIAGDFKLMGYTAYSASREYGPKALKGMNEPVLLSKLDSKGVDAVMLVSLLNKKKETYYVPGRILNTPYGYYYDRFNRHYDIIYERTETPGYYDQDTRYFWECNFYDVHNGKLLYSSISESFDPKSTDGLAHQYASLMIADMVKEKVIVDKIDKAGF